MAVEWRLVVSLRLPVSAMWALTKNGRHPSPVESFQVVPIKVLGGELLTRSIEQIQHRSSSADKQHSAEWGHV